MSVINAPEFSLRRARRELMKSHARQDWTAVKYWDEMLGSALNDAYETRDRKSKSLLREMENILTAYGSIIETMPEQNKSAISHFEE